MEGGRGTYRGAFSDEPACGEALDALRLSSTGALEGASRKSCSEPPARPQGGGLRAVFLAASTRLVLVIEMSGRVFVEDEALIEAVVHTPARKAPLKPGVRWVAALLPWKQRKTVIT